VEVEAPDGGAAMALERRLIPLGATAIWRRGRWIVDLPVVRDVDELEAEVRRWLKEMGVEQTWLTVDGSRLKVGPHPPHRGRHHDFIG
jgi:hypothetical protein